MAASAFLPRELALALFLAGAVEVGLFGLFVVAGQNRARVTAVEAAPPEEIPIAVKPVLDEFKRTRILGVRGFHEGLSKCAVSYRASTPEK